MFYEVVNASGRTVAYCTNLDDADVLVLRHKGGYVREGMVWGVVTKMDIQVKPNPYIPANTIAAVSGTSVVAMKVRLPGEECETS